jgi:hypothetical protein
VSRGRQEQKNRSALAVARCLPIIGLAVLAGLFGPGVAAASDASPVQETAAMEGERLAARLCPVIAVAADARSGQRPLFLRSFDDSSGSGAPREPSLSNAAFAYDNALAIMALIACGHQDAARRIGNGFVLALSGSGTGERLRNAYRAGPHDQAPPTVHGWWEAKGRRWVQDGYQMGTATGNVAWVGLALLSLSEATGDATYAAAAVKAGEWALGMAASDPVGGFSGGVQEAGGRLVRLGWKSTEHHVDLVALFGWLHRRDPVSPERWLRGARAARQFLSYAWIGQEGRFAVGALPDGVKLNRATSGLDAQLWPLLLDEAAPEWRAALDYAQAQHGVGNGFDFNADRDGVWVEGTAQAALALRFTGQEKRAARILADLHGDISPSGYLWAVRAARVSTGLASSPDSKEADFYYYRQPHLGATSWAILAAKGWNPFTGRLLSDP